MNYSSNFIEPYGSLIFNSSVLVSAKNMNKLASQLVSGQYLITHHNHYDLYYSKTEMTSKYFSNTNRSGSDADKVEGYHFSDLIGSALPKYSIIAWESATIPNGYAICNGQTVNNVTTMDLRDYFLPTAGNSYTLGQTFGSNTFTISANTITIANYALTIDQLPNHCHSYIDTYFTIIPSKGYKQSYQNNFTSPTDTSTLYTGYTGGGGSHNHTSGSSLSINSSFVNANNRPSYYALYFIEKVV